ncbi:MAG: hypothetical protein B7Z29_16935 [Hyphomicrobium sp. 12-62-95]|nr:MAG: hypothetical protein B7Z29_16935 [Hyphomicrobium sp. 12-62-95]
MASGAGPLRGAVREGVRSGKRGCGQGKGECGQGKGGRLRKVMAVREIGVVGQAGLQMWAGPLRRGDCELGVVRVRIVGWGARAAT